MNPHPLVLAAANGGADLMTFLPMIAIVIGIFYFTSYRPEQQERAAREAMLASIVKDDALVTSGGLHGRVIEIDGDVVVLEIADKVRVRVDRSAVARKSAK